MNLPSLVPTRKRSLTRKDPSPSSSVGNTHNNVKSLSSAVQDASSGLSAVKSSDLKESIRQLRNSFALTPTTLLLEVLKSTEPSDELHEWETRFYRAGNEHNLYDILSVIYKHKIGRGILQDWMRSEGADILCDIIDKEMDDAKPSLMMTTTQTTSEFVDNWDVNEIMDPVKKITPTWCKVLDAATSPSRRYGCSNGDEDDKKRNRHVVRFNRFISELVH